MSHWRAIPRSKWAKFAILAIALADCAGIYIANQRLNRPWVDPATGLSGEPITEADQAPAFGETAARSQSTFASQDPAAATLRSRDVLAALPEYMPLPRIVEQKLPAYDPAAELVMQKADLETPRMAKLQPARMPSRRFVSAFASDIAIQFGGNAAVPNPGMGDAASASAYAGQPEDLGDAIAADATGRAELVPSEAPAPSRSSAEVPEAEIQTEPPAVDTNAGAELPAS